jgi:hypothetical protein
MLASLDWEPLLKQRLGRKELVRRSLMSTEKSLPVVGFVARAVSFARRGHAITRIEVITNRWSCRLGGRMDRMHAVPNSILRWADAAAQLNSMLGSLKDGFSRYRRAFSHRRLKCKM